MSDSAHVIADGADLMLPGVDPEALPPLPAGAVCAITVPGNPAAIAVRFPLFFCLFLTADRITLLLDSGRILTC